MNASRSVSPMAAAVKGDATIVVGGQMDHLVFPCVRAQQPVVAEDYGLTSFLFVVIDLRTVFVRDRGHGMFSPLRH